MARSLQARLRQDATAFSDLAAQYSEDPLTAQQGGALGILAASDVRLWPEVLDALAATAPGDVSEVVETPWGFHLFLRQPPPAPATVAAKRILIGHKDAVWLQFLERQDGAPRPWRQREPEEAHKLALRLADELRTAPEHFDALVQEYSDHWDAAQAGDVGSWSSLEPGPHSRALATVGRAAEGEIVGPINTFYGYAVWQRTSLAARPWFAMRSLRFRYDPLLPDEDSRSKLSTKRLAQSVLAELKREPQKFAELQRQYGEQPQRWTRGRGRRGVEQALTQVKVGEIADKLIDADWAFLIAQRMAPEELPLPPTPLTELPAPNRIAIEYYVARLIDSAREDLLGRASRACDFDNELSESVDARFRAAVSTLNSDLARSTVEQERLATSVEFLSMAQSLLGSFHFECLHHELDVILREELIR